MVNYADRITRDPKICGGEPIMRGTQRRELRDIETIKPFGILRGVRRNAARACCQTPPSSARVWNRLCFQPLVPWRGTRINRKHMLKFAALGDTQRREPKPTFWCDPRAPSGHKRLKQGISRPAPKRRGLATCARRVAAKTSENPAFAWCLQGFEFTALRGTRIPLRTVLASLADGDTAEAIIAAFPALTIDHVRAAIAYAAVSAAEDLPFLGMPAA